MKASQYCKEYTTGEYIHLKHTFFELQEMWEEIVKFNWKGIKEEWQDALVYFQCWLYSRFKLDQEMWKISAGSAKKFMDRREVWHDIHEYVGLKREVSNFCGNYQRPEKVVKHLAKFGIGREAALEAYERVVKGV